MGRRTKLFMSTIIICVLHQTLSRRVRRVGNVVRVRLVRGIFRESNERPEGKQATLKLLP
jgi:hypothetical protein